LFVGVVGVVCGFGVGVGECAVVCWVGGGWGCLGGGVGLPPPDPPAHNLPHHH